MTSSVSVIIPAFNSATCVGKAIGTALLQEPAPLEVIVIDDGSTDDTAQVARSYGEKVVCLTQANLGPGAARNAGLRRARGEFIAFLDADDFWLPGFLAACVSFLNQHPEAIAVSTGIRFLRRGGIMTEWPGGSAAFARSTPFVIENFFEFWGEHDHVRTGSNVIRKAAIEGAGLQQAHLRISQDLEYWGYLATFGPWGVIPDVYWAGNSESVAASAGWLAKYRMRRRLCPTMEQWQERLVSRLRPEHWPGFRKTRGRIAVAYAQNHILAGRFEVARSIVRNYGQEMPACWSGRLLRTGCRAGRPAWWLTCALVRVREYQKALSFSLSSRRRPSRFEQRPRENVGEERHPLAASESSWRSPGATACAGNPARGAGASPGSGEGQVSVVVPAFNAAPTLPCALDSILRQTLATDEVIVVDDGSQDDTVAVAAEYTPRVRLLSQPHAGPAAARNAGLRQARGKFVAILDADDFWQSDFLRAGVQFLESHPTAVAVSTGLCFIHANGSVRFNPSLGETAGRTADGAQLLESPFEFWAEHDHVRTGSVLARREALLEAGLQNESLRVAEDLEFWALLSLQGKWGFIPRPLWICNSEPAGVSAGWLRKYRDRRYHCPTVEQWQQRILPRLGAADWPAFRKVRGRVAAILAQNHVLAGRAEVARQILRDFGAEMPAVWTRGLLWTGHRLGALGWTLACGLVKVREFQKAALLACKALFRLQPDNSILVADVLRGGNGAQVPGANRSTVRR